MGAFILRRLIQAVFTVFGVMLLTFVLFRYAAGDVSAQFSNPKLGPEARFSWLRKHNLHLPWVLNFQRRVLLVDRTDGNEPFRVADADGAKVTGSFVLERLDANSDLKIDNRPTLASLGWQEIRDWWWHPLDRRTSIAEFSQGNEWTDPPKAVAPAPEPADANEPADPNGPSDADTPASEDANSASAPQPPADADATSGEDPNAPPDANAPAPPRPVMVFHLSDGSTFPVDVDKVARLENRAWRPDPNATVGDLLSLINDDPNNAGRVEARLSDVRYGWGVFHSQFFRHFVDSVTFQNKSYKTDEKLTKIIADKAPYSLALTIPILAMGWFLALLIASIVAYFRGSAIDVAGVFLCVLGMCVPFLVYMIAGQLLIMEIAPSMGWGIASPINMFVPIGIAVFAGLGGNVRFYRTVILDEVNRDYVRTARAKGVPLAGILYRHVLKNCMLPILTSLVVSIPFLILGSMLLERFFGIPGLGDLLVSSVSDRDVPVISGLTFLTAVIYVIGLLLTDVLYAVFDPRVRLR